MKKSIILAISIIAFSCQKEVDPTNTSDEFDQSKFVNKEWYWGRKETPQMLTINFKANDSAVLTKCTWLIAPYRYETQKFSWEPIGKDSVSLGGFHFRVYSVNDTILVTSNWVVGGISDTLRQTFRAY